MSKIVKIRKYQNLWDCMFLLIHGSWYFKINSKMCCQTREVFKSYINCCHHDWNLYMIKIGTLQVKSKLMRLQVCPHSRFICSIVKNCPKKLKMSKYENLRDCMFILIHGSWLLNVCYCAQWKAMLMNDRESWDLLFFSAYA